MVYLGVGDGVEDGADLGWIPDLYRDGVGGQHGVLVQS